MTTPFVIELLTIWPKDPNLNSFEYEINMLICFFTQVLKGHFPTIQAMCERHMILGLHNGVRSCIKIQDMIGDIYAHCYTMMVPFCMILMIVYKVTVPLLKGKIISFRIKIKFEDKIWQYPNLLWVYWLIWGCVKSKFLTHHELWVVD